MHTDPNQRVALTQENAPYFEIAYLLWARIKATDPRDAPTLIAYGRTALRLADVFDDYIPRGFMLELFHWTGVIKDMPTASAVEFANDIPVVYPEVFEYAEELGLTSTVLIADQEKYRTTHARLAADPQTAFRGTTSIEGFDYYDGKGGGTRRGRYTGEGS